MKPNNRAHSQSRGCAFAVIQLQSGTSIAYCITLRLESEELSAQLNKACAYCYKLGVAPAQAKMISRSSRPTQQVRILFDPQEFLFFCADENFSREHLVAAPSLSDCAGHTFFSICPQSRAGAPHSSDYGIPLRARTPLRLRLRSLIIFALLLGQPVRTT